MLCVYLDAQISSLLIRVVWFVCLFVEVLGTFIYLINGNSVTDREVVFIFSLKYDPILTKNKQKLTNE